MDGKAQGPLKPITLQRAIRAYCLWCCCNQPMEVRLCPAHDIPVSEDRTICALWPYRCAPAQGKPPLNRLKSIRARCLDCAENRTEIDRRPFNGKKDILCPLYPFRFGHSPKRTLSPAAKAHLDAVRHRFPPKTVIPPSPPPAQ